MKPYILCFLMLLIITSVLAQQETIDRLKHRLAMDQTDSAKCMTLDSLSMYNMFFNNKSDSTLYYCNEYIKDAFQIPDKKYLILAYARLSFYFINTTQYKEALDMALKGLDLSEQYHIKDYLSALYYDLTWFYSNMNDSKEALNNAFKGISFLKTSRDPFFDQALHLYALIGNVYLNTGNGDSAIFYIQKSDSIAKVSKELAAKNVTYWDWSLYYLNYKKDYQKADSVISEGITGCLKYREFLLNFFYIFSSYSYLSQGRTGEAIAQARKAYELSLPLNDPAGENLSADLLKTCFEKSGHLDSAYRYLKIKDSLNNVIKVHSNAIEIQQYRFEQQLNRKEQESARVLQEQKNRNRILVYVFITALLFLLIIAFIQWRNNNQKKKANILLQHQKEKVESTLSELKSAQAQLIQSEKMASLGELTAGIAHEIQNPLNFVNNFSEVNSELVAELKEELAKGNVYSDSYRKAIEIADSINDNQLKINEHGKRADAIVKSMLQHSRGSSNQKELTDINALSDEFLKLAYHGMRARNKSFNAELKTDFDPSLPKINVVPQDIGRVLVNLINNAFFAIFAKASIVPESDYVPEVSIVTKNLGDKIEIQVKDNGPGIPEEIKDKIFQPFFTTKPAGQGTGLGLSLSYDIIKAHNGEIKVDTNEGLGLPAGEAGTEFTIHLPIKTKP